MSDDNKETRKPLRKAILNPTPEPHESEDEAIIREMQQLQEVADMRDFDDNIG